MSTITSFFTSVSLDVERHYSTAVALTEVIHSIYSFLDKHKFRICIFHITQAFDSLNYNILLKNCVIMQCNVIVKNVHCSRYLDVMNNNNLTWQHHIQYVYMKLFTITHIFLQSQLPI